MPHFSGQMKVGTGGDEADFQNDLGYQDKNFNGLSFGLKDKNNTSRWNFSFGKYGYDGTTILNRDIKYNDQTFVKGEVVSSDIKIQYYTVGYAKKFVKRGNFSSSYKANLSYVKINSGMKNAANSNNESCSTSALLPILGVAVNEKLGSKLDFYGDFSGLSSSGHGHFYCYDAGLKWQISNQALLQGGYRVMDASIKGDDSYAVLRMKGPYLSFRYNF
jgi:hypothetical protein